MITITESAIKAFSENLKSDNSENKYIRVYVQGGGCSGYKYLLDLVESPQEDDEVIEQSGLRFVIDEMSKPFLEGVTIDYTSNLLESGFKFDNPKATKTCGCKQSFSI